MPWVSYLPRRVAGPPVAPAYSFESIERNRPIVKVLCDVKHILAAIMSDRHCSGNWQHSIRTGIASYHNGNQAKSKLMDRKMDITDVYLSRNKVFNWHRCISKMHPGLAIKGNLVNYRPINMAGKTVCHDADRPHNRRR